MRRMAERLSRGPRPLPRQPFAFALRVLRF